MINQKLIRTALKFFNFFLRIAELLHLLFEHGKYY